MYRRYLNKFIYLSIYLTLRLFRFCRYLHYLERGAAKNRTVPSAFTIARGPCVFVQIRQTFERTIVLDRSGCGTKLRTEPKLSRTARPRCGLRKVHIS